MLIGEKSLENAWKILTKMYGNKTMMANKLKTKLKNIKVSGKEDHDVIINLAIEVKTIVKNLTEMKMEEMLKHDDEYLSAIFKGLPSQERSKWLNFDKDTFSCEWKAMEAFIDGAHNKATETKILLTNYAAQEPAAGSIRCKKCHKIGHKKDECPDGFNVKIAASKSKQEDDSDEETVKKQRENEKQKAKDACGKCPQCRSRHTFKRRSDGQIWPSDRFSSCEQFRNMSEKDRASVLERNKSCSRCLSWNHDRSSKDCKAPKSSCGLDKGSGNLCKSDHSRMVCGSGSVYCASVRFSKKVQKSSSDQKEKFSSAELEAETLMLLEDVKINSSSKFLSGRVLWDGGSNRVLINNQFAKDHKLRRQEITYRLSVVGGKETVEKGVVYEVELLDNNGQVEKIWGFGID